MSIISAPPVATEKLPPKKRLLPPLVAYLVRTRAAVWFVRENDKFVDLKPGDDGILRSRIFPGLWLHPAALIAGDMRRVNHVLNQGIASPEHAAFMARMTNHPMSQDPLPGAADTA